MTARSRAPILVTGLPRSGTTWLARELATARNTALPGREPMNPREGQFALGGHLSAWARLGPVPDDRQRRTLRRVYRGWEPRAYGRFGIRAWAAPLPWVRVIVKDPFALLSLPAVTTATGARAVVLFRHPAALLASYRRMGWRPDVQEIRDLGLGGRPGVPDMAQPDDDVGAMGWFWAACYAQVLRDLATLPDALVVDHAALVGGGHDALRALASRLGVQGLHATHATHATHAAHAAHAARPPDAGRAAQTGHAPDAGPTSLATHRRSEGSGPRLHRFDRAPAEVAEGWRHDVAPEDVRRLEALTAPVLQGLSGRSVRFGASEATGTEVTP